MAILLKQILLLEGNARVIRARLADAQFFYQADCDEHLDSLFTPTRNCHFPRRFRDNAR